MGLFWKRSASKVYVSSRQRFPSIFFINTLSEQKELFIPLKPEIVTLYSCGPTVYSTAHIGNFRSYVFSDTIVRVLKASGYHVRRVINITDVGHLVGDNDEGEDKITVSATRERVSPEVIATRYAKQFLEDIRELNIDTDDIQFPRATAYIKEQIALVKTLEEKGFAYRTLHGLVFDTARFPSYGRLGHIDLSAQRTGVRVETNPDKKHPYDFLLWRAAKPYDLQQWDSPWGRGNPGWHIECSAMSRALLGQEIDIHTGGEDHIQIHHNNEIAQSEAASGRTFVRYWMHNAFLSVQGEKISKSLYNDILLSDIIRKGFSPLSLRYFFLQAHYRTPLSFSWNALSAAENALERLWEIAEDTRVEAKERVLHSEARDRFLVAMRDDLGTPQALGILWESLKSDEYAPEEKWGLLQDADIHFGLSLLEHHKKEEQTFTKSTFSSEIAKELAERETARQNGDFLRADALRADIEKRGYRVDDGPEGPVLTRTTL